MSVRIFLSTVSDEFRAYRDALRSDSRGTMWRSRSRRTSRTSAANTVTRTHFACRRYRSNQDAAGVCTPESVIANSKSATLLLVVYSVSLLKMR